MSLLRILSEEVSVVADAAEDMDHPHLKPEGNGRYCLVVEGAEVFTGIHGLEESMMLWAIAHFVLNQKTAHKVRNTLWFMCTKVLNAPFDTERQPSAAAKAELEKLAKDYELE